jgi:hypothetical protein
MTGNVLETATATEVSFTDPDETETSNSELEGENMSHDQKMEGGSRKKEHSAGIKRGGKRQKLTAVDIDKQYLDSLKEIGKRMEETSSDYDTVCTQPPSGNETGVTIGQSGLQG